MRKSLFLVVVCIYSLISEAQNVGIGTPNPQNKLHVAGGLRLDTLTGVNGSGLLWHNPNGVVYGLKFSGNINEVLRGDGTFGPYNPAINGALGWLLNGNSGTNPATNFLGTIDNQPLVFKVNNTRHGYLSRNIFLGSNAGLANAATAIGNIGIGSGALGRNTLAYAMVAIGDSALFNADLNFSAAMKNTAIGYRTLFANNTGSENTAVGSNSLESNTTGNTNTAIGTSALNKNTTGRGNVAVGYALISNTSGQSNTSVGNQSLLFSTVGENNTALGFNALIYNTTGNYNTALGALAGAGGGFGIGTGNGNTSVGYLALALNRTSENTAVGYRAMWGNTIGSGNNALGAYALEKNTTGGLNTAFGYAALQANTGSYGNSAFGYLALAQCNGSLGGNSALGRVALYSNTTGYSNTAVGEAALYNNVSGFNNTAVGELAGAALPNNVSNVTVIGYNTGWNTTISNQVNIGNFSVTWIGGQTGWFHYSDKRIKNDIKDDVPGLSFITRLKPITYHVDVRKQEEIVNAGKKINSELKEAAQKDWEGKYDVEKIKMTGFFAQDVEEAAKSINYSFSGVHNPKNGGLYSLDYSAFVVPLVKAVQEQQALIQKQQKQRGDLLKRIEALEKK